MLINGLINYVINIRRYKRLKKKIYMSIKIFSVLYNIPIKKYKCSYY